MQKLTMAKFRDAVVNGQTIDVDGNSVNKGVLLSSAGGVLPPAAFSEFLDDMVTTSPILNVWNLVPVNRPQMELHSLAIAARSMVVATPGTEVSTGTLTPTERTLDPTRAILVLDVSYDWLDDNADGRDADAVIRQKLSSTAAWDLVDLAGNGDGSTGTFLSINSGFPVLAAADSAVHDYDATNTTFLGSTGILSNMAALMPEKYLPGAAFFMARSEFETVLSEMGTRATGLGDEVLKNGGPIYWHGHPIYGVYAWPTDKVIMSNPKNLFVGLFQNIRVSVEDKPAASCLRYTVDMRVDYNHGVGDAVVYGTTD
jgi:HK97 family phage major capsid protein